MNDPPLFRLFNEIGIIEHLARTEFERVLPHNMSVAQFTVLNHFVRLGLETSSPSRLASAFQVTKGAITNSLHRLVALGFATSEPDPADARGKIVRITAAGRAARETAIQALAPRMQALAAQIDIAELEAILPTLERFRRVLDAARNG